MVLTVLVSTHRPAGPARWATRCGWLRHAAAAFLLPDRSFLDRANRRQVPAGSVAIDAPGLPTIHGVSRDVTAPTAAEVIGDTIVVTSTFAGMSMAQPGRPSIASNAPRIVSFCQIVRDVALVSCSISDTVSSTTASSRSWAYSAAILPTSASISEQ